MRHPTVATVATMEAVAAMVRLSNLCATDVKVIWAIWVAMITARCAQLLVTIQRGGMAKRWAAAMRRAVRLPMLMLSQMLRRSRSRSVTPRASAAA